jgi:hypothetical protein
MTGAEDERVELDARPRYPSMVLRRGESLVLEMLVASGHLDRRCTFPISERHLAVLRDDDVRYLLLFAALHHPSQLRETELAPAEVEVYLDTILAAPREEVAAFLTSLDRGRANGAISNLVHLVSGVELSGLRAGRWFELRA